MEAKSRPQLSYTIWFSQRTGSTLLCKGLASTGIAGKPSEWLYKNNNLDFLTHYQVNNYAELQDKIWQLGSTSNRVFGLKTSICEPNFSEIIDILKKFPPCNPKSNKYSEIWHQAFPNCKHIFMTRRNKVRLAVSWWKAIKTGEWHRKTGTKPTSVQIQNKYSYKAINHLFIESCIREAAIQEFFTEVKIIPLTIVYEDFVLSYRETIQRIIDYLEILNSNNLQIALPAEEQLADAVSENWVQRFMLDRQKGWKNRW
ncbi:MAG: Stf0 family sulfotransferase [Xenococcaceae cyanobacterium]